MYHEITFAEQKRRRNKRILHALIVIVVAAAVVAAFMVMKASAREQGVVSTRDAIMTAAKQCCAVEGSYPSTVRHLEEHYGLVINHDDYVVSYEWFADNVMPSVVVTAR
ncbi:MAG: hypothetical protein E7Z99_05245 [Coriobacteriaceae bacterium]|jgi:hypothetical protein|nr:hypothetical protein [Coriobacteriaceae bacterium]